MPAESGYQPEPLPDVWRLLHLDAGNRPTDLFSRPRRTRAGATDAPQEAGYGAEKAQSPFMAQDANVLMKTETSVGQLGCPRDCGYPQKRKAFARIAGVEAEGL